MSSLVCHSHANRQLDYAKTVFENCNQDFHCLAKHGCDYRKFIENIVDSFIDGQGEETESQDIPVTNDCTITHCCTNNRHTNNNYVRPPPVNAADCVTKFSGNLHTSPPGKHLGNSDVIDTNKNAGFIKLSTPDFQFIGLDRVLVTIKSVLPDSLPTNPDKLSPPSTQAKYLDIDFRTRHYKYNSI